MDSLAIGLGDRLLWLELVGFRAQALQQFYSLRFPVKPKVPNIGSSMRHGGQRGGPAMKGKRIYRIHCGKRTERPVTTGQYTKQVKAGRFMNSKLMREFRALVKQVIDDDWLGYFQGRHQVCNSAKP